MRCHYHSFLPHLGYGVAAKGYLELIRQDARNQVNWTVHQFDNHYQAPYLQEFQGPSQLNVIHLTPNYIPRVFDRQALNLANTTFESTQLPAEWKQALDSVDKIAVPCRWNQAVFEQALNRKIYLLPHTSQFAGQPPSLIDNRLELAEDVFVFLTVGTWERRKNLAQLVTAFCRAFSRKDPVVLLIKTSANDVTKRKKTWRGHTYLQTTRDALREVMRYEWHAPTIKLIADVLPDAQLHHLYARSDAYVTLTHGEGWGLGCFEAAWFGKPVIATGFGGYLDFLKEDNSFLLPYQLIPYKKNFWDEFDRSTHYYAQPDLSASVDYLRYVYEHPAQASARGQQLKQFVTTNFTKEIINQHLQAFLRD